MEEHVQVRDLFEGLTYDLSACCTTNPVGDYLPVRSQGRNLWYVYDLERKTSRLIHELSVTAQTDILSEIYRYEKEEAERNAEADFKAD